jgi:uncharacterized repeat protein (TIGR01451 family)
VGQSMTFTMVVTNAGAVDAVDVVAADELPAGLTANAVSDPACAIAGSSVSCAFGILSSGTTRQFTVTATPTTAGTFTNIAMVSTANPDTNPDNNIASATGNVIAVQPPTPPTTLPPTLPPTTQPPGTLPPTGSSGTVPPLWIAGSALLAGLALTRIGRRRGRENGVRKSSSPTSAPM